VRFLAEQGSTSAAILQRLRADPNRFLSTVLFVNTLASSSPRRRPRCSAIAVHPLGVPERMALWADAAQSVILSVILLIAAEVTPKDACHHARRARRTPRGRAGRQPGERSGSHPVGVTLISRPHGGRAARAPYLTEEELISMLHVSEEQA